MLGFLLNSCEKQKTEHVIFFCFDFLQGHQDLGPSIKDVNSKKERGQKLVNICQRKGITCGRHVKKPEENSRHIRWTVHFKVSCGTIFDPRFKDRVRFMNKHLIRMQVDGEKKMLLQKGNHPTMSVLPPFCLFFLFLLK